ncbi:hypothetical protein FJT64_016192 [Amphibalanus amphitrite]|uniref:Uncharacterized protein n=1 Tax=Amphibalanus amphitrite TaxID=1232801 RepID=A0A6A4XDK4_AMPAM|nr:hypothetical protein FJT64_016192 [Amphibalanus amphitrite]
MQVGRRAANSASRSHPHYTGFSSSFESQALISGPETGSLTSATSASFIMAAIISSRRTRTSNPAATITNFDTSKQITIIPHCRRNEKWRLRAAGAWITSLIVADMRGDKRDVLDTGRG